MAPMLQRTMIALLAAACLDAAAATSPRPVIAGTVFEDRLALAVRPHFVPAAGVTLKLYRDGGDRQPTADDPLVSTTKTNSSGVYLLRPAGRGDYWLVVDSKSFGDGRGWAEQTFGPAGSLCASPEGTRTLGFEGSCFGGRTALRSDDASALLSSEHLALISFEDSVNGADFAFSFDVVTTVADGDGIQGSLRQFMRNATAIAGPNRMRFVPLEAAPVQRETTYGVPPRWWKMTLTAPLPEINDADTIVDGTAYNFVSAGSVVEMHPGRLEERATIGLHDARIQKIEKPDLEIVMPAGEYGFVCNARCGLHSFAAHGTAVGVRACADLGIEDVLLGAAPDGAAPPERGRVGVQVDSGVTTARHLLVTGQSEVGIRVEKTARLEAERIDVSGCGTLEAGGAVLLLSNGSSIRNSSITANPGAGVIVGAIDGSAPAGGNSIDRSTLASSQSGVVFGPGSSRNAVTHNEIIWNRFGGVTSAVREGYPAPKENRISANRFDENGLRPVVLELDVENPNQLIASHEGCEGDPARSNLGISTPRVTSARVLRDEKTARVVVRGKACPGEIVEIYQSFVTSGVRDKTAELPAVRKTDDKEAMRETLTNEERTRALPSIGEFNYLGATNTASDGTFEVSFPLVISIALEKEADAVDEETDIWANQVLPAADAEDRAFSAIAIDSAGNTSEMSVRRGVD